MNCTVVSRARGTRRRGAIQGRRWIEVVKGGSSSLVAVVQTTRQKGGKHYRGDIYCAAGAKLSLDPMKNCHRKKLQKRRGLEDGSRGNVDAANKSKS